MGFNEQEQAALELLPWYLNDTLAPEERELVEKLLEISPEARKELEILKTLRQSMLETEAVTAPVELSWRRFRKKLPSRTEHFPVAAGWRKLAAAVAVVTIAVQFGVIMHLQSPPDIVLLGEKDGAQQVDPDSFQLKIMFREQADWREITALLVDLEARLVEGPSAIGLVVIAIDHRQDRGEVTRLLEQAAIVEHFQVIPGD